MKYDLNEILEIGEKGGFAVPAFNVYNLETALGVKKAVEETGAPVIFQMYSRLADTNDGNFVAPAILEAIRQLRWEEGAANTCFIHGTLLPYISAAKEVKTKPTQHSVKTLQGAGIAPDVIVCRTESPVPEEQRGKIALFCNVFDFVDFLHTGTLQDIRNLNKIMRMSGLHFGKIRMIFVYGDRNIFCEEFFLGKIHKTLAPQYFFTFLV